MPANRGQTPDWHPKPDFQANWYPQQVVETPGIDLDDESQVAAWLVDTPEYEVYAFIPSVRVQDLALEAAKEMVAKRRMQDRSGKPNSRECVRPALHGVQTIAVVCRKVIDTGEPLPSLSTAVERTRSFG